MSKYMTKYNAENLLEQLDGKGFVSDQKLSDFVIGQQQEKELPLYVRSLAGVGAFFSSMCFIGFLITSEIIDIDNEVRTIILGLIFVLGAVGLRRIVGHDSTVKRNFLMQFSFALMAVGKALFALSVGQILDSGWAVTLALLVITGITYHVYRMSVDRFLSSFAVLFSILINILCDQDVSASRELLLNGFFLFQFVGAAILLTHGKIKRDYIPLSYAFTFSLCASVLFLASYAELGYWEYKELIHPYFINMVLTCGLIALFGWTAGGMEKLKAEPLVLTSLGVVLLGLISAPGILLTIGLMVFGYATHEKKLITTGALLMPVFLFLYYYNLDISLLQKSAILIGSGGVLLAGRAYLQYKGWHEGGASCAQK